jgi:hypothetical protein
LSSGRWWTLVFKEWVAMVGPQVGNQSRLGSYEWAQFQQFFYQETGRRNEQQRVMKTKKEFVTSMEAKGKSKDWAENEFARRGQIEGGTDTCPDTGLIRVRMHGETLQADFNVMGRQKRVLEATKQDPNSMQILVFEF